MNMKPALLFILLISSLAITGCGGEAKDDFRDVSFSLVDQNGEEVIFPDDFRGKPLVLGFIYTHCPDICSIITANLYRTWIEMDEPEDIQFVLATFDPERDTPEVLKEYAADFRMDRPPFRFLTGSEEEISAFMERVRVRNQVSDTRETYDGEEMYFLDHSDKILLIDQNSRLVMDYGGSMTPANIIIEDLQKL
jgi:protein SCO1